MRKPICYVLVGVPGSGKSTWYDNNRESLGDAVYVSTDYFVEQYAKSCGSTYSEVFDAYMPVAVNLMVQQVVKARASNLDIVWDQTNTTIKSRKRKFNMLPDYDHIAVVFAIPEKAELDRRLANRPGKTIPAHVITGMINNFQMPTVAEGFKEIRYV
jgi:predicted kinase